MLYIYLKLALRNISVHKTFSILNISGLAVGIAAALMIFLYVKDETSYDSFYKDSSRIYRVVSDLDLPNEGKKIPLASSPAVLAPAIQDKVPEIQAATRIYTGWDRVYLFKTVKNNKTYPVDKAYMADPHFFEVFSCHFISGNAQTALKDIKSVVLTRSSAKKFFGNTDPIGQLFDDGFTVTAVIEDFPANSHFNFNVLLSMENAGNVNTNWGSYNYFTYVKFKRGTDINKAAGKIQAVYKAAANGRDIFSLQQISDIHLNPNRKYDLGENNDRTYIYIFSFVGIFIILIAAINYMNLATAKASVRAKEIGVRKVLGAHKSSLITLFLIESMAMCMLALVAALVLVQFALPLVNTITDKHLIISIDVTLLYTIAGTMMLGFIAGILPALYLSSFRPVPVLKGLKLTEGGTLILRKSLVVLQFTISVVLIIGAIIVSRQVEYMRSAKLGLNPDQVVVINKYFSAQHKDAFLNELKNTPGVKAVAGTGHGAIIGTLNSRTISSMESNENHLLYWVTAGNDYQDVLDIKIKEGRGFSDKFPADTMRNGDPNGAMLQIVGGVVLNETAVKEFGFKEPVIGKQLMWGGTHNVMYHLSIVGVMKDFHVGSMHEKIKPLAFINEPRSLNGFTVRLSTTNVHAVLNKLESKWKVLNPDVPFQYFFVDEAFAKLYKADVRFGQVFTSLVILGIFIACLGLFGLAAFSAELRVKEIGIRKVLGASVQNIVTLVSKDFIRLIVLACIIASPIALYLMNRWLENFAYRITIQWWVFVLAIVIAVLIAIVTISFQSVKAATANPVKSLRSE